MIKIYRSITSMILDGKEVRCNYSLPYFEDENKIKEHEYSFILTWDNIAEVFYKCGSCLPFNLWKIKNNYRIEFYNGYGYRTIKQKKVKELNMQVLITTEEITDISLEQVFKINDNEMAIKYLKERGLNICPVQK